MSLVGKRVLLVEDEFLIAAMVQDMLADLGAVVVGPAHRLADARSLAEESDLDIAIIDVNLGGERSDPIAEILAARGIPFILATGYGDAMKAPRVHVLDKPFTMDKLATFLARALNAKP
jgi:DNA-binding NtrC family response regulator